VEPESVHDLIWAHALDALDEHERQEFENHLRTCAACRDALPSVRGAVASLGGDADPVAVPRRVRRRLLRHVRRDPR
jgi:anti-sigma factor RsiW